MCGIAGLLSYEGGASENSIHERLEDANRIQGHRGPDASGSVSRRVGTALVGLAHQRLSIIDLSDAAGQPMTLANGRYALVFNGEIYNYLELRSELAASGCEFRTASDTEVLMNAIVQWGMQVALEKMNGMWAFAFLDSETGELTLSRDRFGEKPLYYRQENERFYFASEIKTILEMSKQRYRINLAKAGEYLFQSLHDTDQETFFEGVLQVPQGSFLTIGVNDRTLRLAHYYSVVPRDSGVTLSDAVESLRFLLRDSVRIRLRSDVPVGVLLSGGLDSSAIAAYAESINRGEPSQLMAVSAVSRMRGYCEEPFIDEVTRHLNMAGAKVMLQPDRERIRGLIRRATWHNDEPIGSLGNVYHYLLMEKAGDFGVKVVLSGQGADELLCGYRKYLGFYLKILAGSGRWSSALKSAASFARNGTVFSQFSLAEASRYLRTGRMHTVRGDALAVQPLKAVGIGGVHSLKERQMRDVSSLSVPILNHYEDRMSMAFGREIRLPFLDHRIVDLLFSLPDEYKLHDGWTKYVLRKAIEAELPAGIVWRKDKQGFINPQKHWFKHELREEVADCLEDPGAFIYRSALVNQQELLKLFRKFASEKDGFETVWYRDVMNAYFLEIWAREFAAYLSD